MRTLWGDLRLAARLLARAPTFSLAVIVVIAVGVGANSAVFTALDQAIVRPLPYPGADRLVMVWEDFTLFGVPKQRVSPRTYLDWKMRNRTLDDVAAFGGDVRNLAGDGPPEEVLGQHVTANFFHVLGVRPLLGRTFTSGEETPETKAVVLSYRLWQRRYGGRRDIVGTTVLMNGEKRDVIGVMPQGFDYPDRGTQFWSPLGLPAEILARRNSHFLRVVARLLPRIDVARAQADMQDVAARLAAEFPATNERVGATVVSLADEMVGDTRRAFLMLIGAAASVLLIACANIANLLLARAVRRRPEIAIRVALGASPVRIVVEMLTESVLLSGTGALAGLMVARWALAMLQQMLPTAISGFVTLHIDARVLAFTAVVSVASALVFGGAPALYMAGLPAMNVRGSVGDGSRWLRSALVVVEIAVALVLAVGAGLLIQTLAHLNAVDPGFRPKSILTASIPIPIQKYPGSDSHHRFYSDILERVHAIPGVVSAGLTSDLPYTSRGNSMGLLVEGQPAPKEVGQDALFRLVSAGYLTTIGARLVQGRWIDEHDIASSLPVVVVNETMARRFWPDGRALGRRIDTGTGGGQLRWMTIVGVVADIRERGLDLATKAAVYVPFTQTEITFFQPSELAVLTSREPLTIAREVQNAVWAVDGEQPVSDIRTMEEIVEGEFANRTQVLQLLGTFAALALVLAALGIYSVLSFLVSQGTREIGLRMAIGAGTRDIMAAIFGYTARMTLAGIAIGAAAAAGATRLLSSLLSGVTPLDWKTFAGVAFLLTMVAVAAAYAPTRRAVTIDPAVALRDT
jgi:putative ABC transport system permease protein